MVTTASVQPATRQVSVASSLSGVWRNQLGSELVLAVDDAGTLTGTYRTAAGEGHGVTHPVHGSCDGAAVDGCRVLGFGVTWAGAHAQTVWCGRYQGTDDAIRASWLMTTASDVADEWRSTVVGHDVFRRQPAPAVFVEA